MDISESQKQSILKETHFYLSVNLREVRSTVLKSIKKSKVLTSQRAEKQVVEKLSDSFFNEIVDLLSKLGPPESNRYLEFFPKKVTKLTSKQISPQSLTCNLAGIQKIEFR